MGDTEGDSALMGHARRELGLAGLLEEDSEYDGMLGKAVLEIVEVFSRQGHSGASAALVTGIVERLLRYDVLTPLTYGPEEWVDQGEINGFPVWQNIRKPSIFSKDHGRTHYDLDDSPAVSCRRCGGSGILITPTGTVASGPDVAETNTAVAQYCPDCQGTGRRQGDG